MRGIFRKKRKDDPDAEILLRKGAAAARREYRLPHRGHQKLHPRSGGAAAGGDGRADPVRLQHADRHPHPAGGRYPGGRTHRAQLPAVRRHHPENAR